MKIFRNSTTSSFFKDLLLVFDIPRFHADVNVPWRLHGWDARGPCFGTNSPCFKSSPGDSAAGQVRLSDLD